MSCAAAQQSLAQLQVVSEEVTEGWDEQRMVMIDIKRGGSMERERERGRGGGKRGEGKRCRKRKGEGGGREKKYELKEHKTTTQTHSLTSSLRLGRCAVERVRCEQAVRVCAV